MSFHFPGSVVPVRSAIRELFRREWERLGSSGTWWSAKERVAIAAVARVARAKGTMGGGTGLPPPAVTAARLVAAEPASADRSRVEGFAAAGLDPARYVELVGIVSRLVAVDVFHRALAAELEPLPIAADSPPLRTPPPSAAQPGRAFVPMVGGSSIVAALSLVPSEMQAQEDMHGPMYLTYEQMADLDYERGLHRSQMELIAARVSYLNECFY